MDLYSRRIVGWSMDRRISRHLVLDAMTMTLEHRDKPVLHETGDEPGSEIRP